MAYFPIFMDLAHLRVLVVGGGCIAAQKIEKLLDFTTEITVIAKALNSQTDTLVRKHVLTCHRRPYRQGDITGFDIVIVATDTGALHKSIYEESRQSRILVNSVDNTDYCDFIFPSYIKREDLTIAFSTSGTSPAFAKRLRGYFARIIPSDVGVFLKQMKALRATLPKGERRMRIFEEMVDRYFRENIER